MLGSTNALGLLPPFLTISPFCGEHQCGSRTRGVTHPHVAKSAPRESGSPFAERSPIATPAGTNSRADVATRIVTAIDPLGDEAPFPRLGGRAGGDARCASCGEGRCREPHRSRRTITPRRTVAPPVVHRLASLLPRPALAEGEHSSRRSLPAAEIAGGLSRTAAGSSLPMAGSTSWRCCSRWEAVAILRAHRTRGERRSVVAQDLRLLGRELGVGESTAIMKVGEPF